MPAVQATAGQKGGPVMSKDIRLSEKHGVNPMLVQCFICGNDTGEIALLGRLQDDAEAPRKGVLRGATCDTCKGWMRQGVILIVVKDGSQIDPIRTGELHVITEEAAKRMFNTIGTSRVAYLEEAAAREIGLPKPAPEVRS